MSACSSEWDLRERTAEAFSEAIAAHDAAALEEVLQGTPEDASKVIDATTGFTPTGTPLIVGTGDSALIRCVWVLGQADQKDTYIAGQLLWENEEERYYVLPGFLPGAGRPAPLPLPCDESPSEVSGLEAYDG